MLGAVSGGLSTAGKIAVGASMGQAVSARYLHVLRLPQEVDDGQGGRNKGQHANPYFPPTGTVHRNSRLYLCKIESLADDFNGLAIPIEASVAINAKAFVI